VTGADESGFTLIELLVGMTLSLVILAATLTTFTNFERGAQGVSDLNDSAELARNALDTQARQLRNVAKRVASPVIDTLDSNDLIFQTAEPSRTWVRYCLDTTTAPASPDRGRLWTAELAVASAAAAAPVSPAMRAGCPGTGWTETRVVADYVTNRRPGFDRPLFTYACRTGTGCVSTAATYDEVVSIAAQTFIDTTPGKDPVELRVSSGVHLRNQNQAPVAGFVATPTTSRTVVLNASGSVDYEGRTLDYYWFKQTMPALASINCASPTVTGSDLTQTLWGATGYIGDGVTLSYTFPLTDGIAGLTRNIGLVVCDPGDRYGTAGVAPQPAIAVVIPG
jgi:prepilin-type N-terminal cleavage/methylation domain-containing protein